MRKLLVLVLSVCVFSGIASAGTTVSVQGIDFDFVTIGNAGNAANVNGYGAVGYEYQIGKYEVTNGQWDAFVSAAGAPTGNPGDGYDEVFLGARPNHHPVGFVSWYEAAQFCNYLTSGDKYSGAYKFDTSGNFTGTNRESAILAYEIAYVLPTADEWYKAAFYTPDGNGYSLYANRTNTAPVPGVDSNYAGSVGRPWIVGSGVEEQNGTFDIMGNLWEWSETEMLSCRLIFGGSYLGDENRIRSSNTHTIGLLNDESKYIGLRVVAISTVTTVPTPGAVLLAGFGTSIVGIIRRRIR